MFNADPIAVARYFDHGATSFPKPRGVAEAISHYIDAMGGTYGRAAYSQAYQTSAMVFSVREKLAHFIGASDSSRIIFTQNATMALNIAIAGTVKPGSVVYTSPLEHNSVMRPLSKLCSEKGVSIKTLPHRKTDGTILPNHIQLDKKSSLVVINLQSNVNGVIQPLSEIRNKIGHVPLLVDGAQAVGDIPIDVEAQGIHLLAVPGHKHLLGPTGTGALYVNKSLSLSPLLPGGTGSRSESIDQPTQMPDALEGGTPNIAGIAGLGAALDFLNQVPPSELGQKALYLIKKLKQIEGLTLHCADHPDFQGGLFSFNLHQKSQSQIADALFRQFGLATRFGLHCAPMAHQTLGTFQSGGTVRIGVGHFHTQQDLDYLVASIQALAQKL